MASSKPKLSLSSNSQVLSPSRERELLEELNNDVKKTIRENLHELGQVFGARVYDELKTSNRTSVITKIKLGLFGCSNDFDENEEEKEKKEGKKSKKAEEILDLILEKREIGLDNIYMNYITIFYVKATKKSTTNDVRVLNMFRFAKRSKFDHPSNNFFIGSDMRLYQDWVDFLENNKLAHNNLMFAPAGGHFRFTNGSLDVDLFYISRVLTTYVEPVLTGIGLVGTGMLCMTLPPLGLAVGVGASGVGAATGITRGILNLVDRKSHGTLLETSSLLPTLDILSNLLFVHSVIGVLKLSPRLSSTFLTSEKFALSVLFTEKALRIGAISRLSLDILHTVIAVGTGKISLLDAATRIVSSFLFLYNVGIGFELSNETIETILYLPPRLLTYGNIQPYLRLLEDYFRLPFFNMIQNPNEFLGLLSLVLDNLNTSNRFHPENVTTSLQRLMNIKWNLIAEDLNRCSGWVFKFFTSKEYMTRFTNIQMAVVYNLHRRLSKYVLVDEKNVIVVEYTLEAIMEEIIQLWKQMCAKMFKTPEVREYTMVMQFLLLKIDVLLTDNPDPPAQDSTVPVPLSTESNLLQIKEVYARVKKGLINESICSLSAQCNEMIFLQRLTPILYVMENRHATVSFIRQQSTESLNEEVYMDDLGNPSSLCKIDPSTKLGIFVKYVA